MVIPKNWYSSESKRVKRIPYRHFIKHLECTHYTYMLKCHKGPTKTSTNTMGHSPRKKKVKIFDKNEIFPTPFKITPTLKF